MELKHKIVNFIFEHKDEFQLTNATISNFRDYIYDSKGEYLIGGELIADFIKKAIDLIIYNK
jgi:hypothetical protein